MVTAELDKVAAERNALRRLYDTTAGKNPYRRRRSGVNKDEIAEEPGTSPDAEPAKAAAGNGACRAEGQCKDRTGSSHSTLDEKTRHSQMSPATGCPVRRDTRSTLLSDFFGDRMRTKTSMTARRAARTSPARHTGCPVRQGSGHHGA